MRNGHARLERHLIRIPMVVMRRTKWNNVPTVVSSFVLELYMSTGACIIGATTDHTDGSLGTEWIILAPVGNPAATLALVIAGTVQVLDNELTHD